MPYNFILVVAVSDSGIKRGRRSVWVTVNKELPHMVSLSIFFSCLLYIYILCFSRHQLVWDIYNTNLWRPELYRLYPHMTRHPNKCCHHRESLYFWHVGLQVLFLHHFHTWTLIGYPNWNFGWFNNPINGHHLSYFQGEEYYILSDT